MLMRCPQCQYANQVEADTTKPRIICGRCATVIPVEILSQHSTSLGTSLGVSPGVPPVTEPRGAGPTPFESPFMKTPESPLDLDSLLQAPLDTASEPPAPVVPASPSSAFGAPLVEPLPGSEFSWDNEEILDIPRASAANAQNTENPLALDDLLSTSSTSGEVLDAYPPPPLNSPAAFPSAPGASVYDRPFGESTFGQESNTPPLAGYTESSHDYTAGEAASMATEPASSSVFAQDSYVRNAANTYVMATPEAGNKGRLAKVFLAAALAFGLLGIGYFSLSGLVKDWLGLRKQVASASPTPASSRAVATIPSAVPSQSVATASSKTASPSVAASAAASASAKPSPTAPPATPTPAAASKPSPAASKSSPVPTKPTPAPATGSSGHAVGAGEGSLAVQVASFKAVGEAQQALSRLKSAGVEARIVKAEVPGMGTRFRVQAGRFTNEADASKFAGQLRAKGVARDFIVTGYQNQ